MMENQNSLAGSQHSSLSSPQQSEPLNGPRVIVKGKIPQGPVYDSITIINLVNCYRKCGLVWMASRLPREAWLVTECCGMVCAVITWLLIFYATFVVNRVILSQLDDGLWKWTNFLVYNTLALLAFCSHSRAMLTNPGAVEKGNATKENIKKLGLKHGQVVYKCPKCDSIKPERAHHCSICGRCIRKMDHHCPWVNNCIGEFNQKHFVLFTFYIYMVSSHSMLMAIMHFVRCTKDDWASCPSWSPPAQSVFLIFLIFEGLLFGLFTMIMCCAQLHSICTDETGIEQLKGDKGPWEKGSSWANIKSVFGHPFSWRWLSPFHTPCITGKPQMYQYTV